MKSINSESRRRDATPKSACDILSSMIESARPKTLLTTAEVATLLRVHPKHVYRLLRRGLPARRVGSEWRFVSADVMQWATQHGQAQGDEQAHRPPDTASPHEVAGPPALVAANGDVVVEILLALVQARGQPFIGFVHADMRAALGMLATGTVVAAGCHAGGG